MATFYVAELEPGLFGVCSAASDGNEDVHQTYADRAEAEADCEASNTPEPSEARYHAQYAYACGCHN